MLEDFEGSPRSRSRSPWDSFLPSPSDSETSAASAPGSYSYSASQLIAGIPKLVPEVEEGNVEYKLKLTNISALRFARLVTQLKWRLLEGSGQAYYELGVADSGALIGLSRADMEASLETLECMAGEIGASVIVVKEIEVPAEVSRAADVGGLVQGDGWAGKMRKRGAAADEDLFASAAETDMEDSPWSTSNPDTPVEQIVSTALQASDRLVRSHPGRPTAQSSPAIAPLAALDDDLALFSMEPEPEFDRDLDEEAVPQFMLAPTKADSLHAAVTSLVLDISSVYKPRPFRTRTSLSSAPQHFGGLSQGRMRKLKGREKKGKEPKPIALPAPAVPEETKAEKRRAARDKRREDRRRAFLASTDTPIAADAGPLTLKGPATTSADAVTSAEILIASFESLHVAAIETSAVEDVVPVAEVVVDPEADGDLEVLEEVANITTEPPEPRLIVEALVVSKSSIEEAFLDSGGISLV